MDLFYLAKWRENNGDRELKFNYPLTEESVVFDLGGYKGDFAYNINKMYNSNVYVFEPSKNFYSECATRFAHNKKIKCFNYGLFDKSQSFLLSNEGDSSSIVKNTTPSNGEEVFIKNFGEELNSLNITSIDLLKINIEGAEYDLLTYLITSKHIQKIKHVLVQFHDFYPDAAILRDEIRNKLSETHINKWNYPFVWESWSKKD